MIQVLGYIVAILILLGAGLLVLFKGGYVGGLRSGGKVAKKLQIEETRMLGHRQYLVVAEYEGRRMLIGVCPGRIDYLCPLDSDLDEREAVQAFALSKTELSK
ncbi:MAG: flagellar biosynthetic protein FliO [Verrucomicrobiota bacterium]